MKTCIFSLYADDAPLRNHFSNCSAWKNNEVQEIQRRKQLHLRKILLCAINLHKHRALTLIGHKYSANPPTSRGEKNETHQ